MNFNFQTTDVFEWFGKFFGHISVEGLEAFLFQSTKALLVIVLTYLVARYINRRIESKFSQTELRTDKNVLIYRKFSKFVIWILGIAIALYVAGINLTHLFTTSGLIAVALGFMLKSPAENYISGFMLRSESTVKRGDILNIDGEIFRVISVGLRYTIMRNRDECDIIIPNTTLINQTVGNYSSLRRISTMVGVSYASDLKKVREVLEGTCRQLNELSEHPPQVLLTEFGSSSVNYRVSIWTDNPWRGVHLKSDLNEAVWWALKDADIVIAFPQLDLHLPERSNCSDDLT